MALLNERLKADEQMRSQLVDSTASYVARRGSKGDLGSSNHPGGGPDRVKCLHAHVAHQLIAGDNPVGQAAIDDLGWQDPKEPCA